MHLNDRLFNINLFIDSEVYIIYNGVSSILNDSSLKFNTGVPVPLFPLSVDEVIISWRTSKTVRNALIIRMYLSLSFE